MTSNDTLEVAAIVYKNLTMAATSREQQRAVLVIIEQLILLDMINDQPKA